MITETEFETLNAWMKGEIQQPCELWVRQVGRPDQPCGEPADYVASMTSNCCPTISRLVCEEHEGLLTSSGVKCGIHPDVIRATWIERIR